MAGQGLQPALIALLYVFPALAASVLIVRVWRKHVDRLLGGDDALIVIAWFLALGNSIIVHLYVLEMQAGYYPQDVRFDQIDMLRASKLRYALGVEYNPVICLIKASFLWSLHKLRSRNPWIRRSIWALQILNVVYMVATTTVSLVPCLPLKKAWDPTVPGGCYEPLTYVLGNVSVVLITDALVLLIPTWMIYDLQMPLRKKIITIAFLSLGFIVLAIGILRLVWLSNAFKGKINNHSVESAYSAIESSVAIIGASGPTVKYILSRFIPFLRPAFVSSKKASAYANDSSLQASRRARSRYNTDAYDDLDSDSVKREEYEMKNDWRWATKNDSDANSDEQRITNNLNDGIVKTVDWTVSSREDSMAGRAAVKDMNSDKRPEPANVV